jgi:hypothetical protein
MDWAVDLFYDRAGTRRRCASKRNYLMVGFSIFLCNNSRSGLRWFGNFSYLALLGEHEFDWAVLSLHTDSAWLKPAVGDYVAWGVQMPYLLIHDAESER